MGARIAIFSWLTTGFAVLGSLVAGYFETSLLGFSFAILLLSAAGFSLYYFSKR